MERITRNIRDMSTLERSALEHVIGRRLQENQQIIISIADLESVAPEALPLPSDTFAVLPAWCNVHEGLSGAEVDEIEKAIVRTAESRCF